MRLCEVAPYLMYACYVPCAWVGPKLYVETKCFVSYSFDSMSKAQESKEGHLQTLYFVPFMTWVPIPNDVEMLRPKVGLEPNQITI